MIEKSFSTQNCINKLSEKSFEVQGFPQNSNKYFYFKCEHFFIATKGRMNVAIPHTHKLLSLENEFLNYFLLNFLVNVGKYCVVLTREDEIVNINSTFIAFKE